MPNGRALFPQSARVPSRRSHVVHANPFVEPIANEDPEQAGRVARGCGAPRVSGDRGPGLGHESALRVALPGKRDRLVRRRRRRRGGDRRVGAAIAASGRIFARTTGGNVPYENTGPYGVTFDHQGNLYASITYSNIINKFDPTGVYLGDITSPNLSGPIGMATDMAGNLYVANNFGNTISKFDPAGNYLATIGNTATLSGPYGLAFDAAGYLYASNGRAHHELHQCL